MSDYVPITEAELDEWSKRALGKTQWPDSEWNIISRLIAALRAERRWLLECRGYLDFIETSDDDFAECINYMKQLIDSTAARTGKGENE
jgi:hypothetical protein